MNDAPGHAEIAKILGDGGRQRRCRHCSCCMKVIGGRSKCFQQSSGFGFHGFEAAVAAGQIRKFDFEIMSQLRQAFRLNVMLAGQLLGRGQPRFHLVLAGRVVLQAAQSPANLVHRIAELDAGLVQGGGR